VVYLKEEMIKIIYNNNMKKSFKIMFSERKWIFCSILHLSFSIQTISKTGRNVCKQELGCTWNKTIDILCEIFNFYTFFFNG